MSVFTLTSCKAVDIKVGNTYILLRRSKKKPRPTVFLVTVTSATENTMFSAVCLEINGVPYKGKEEQDLRLADFGCSTFLNRTSCRSFPYEARVYREFLQFWKKKSDPRFWSDAFKAFQVTIEFGRIDLTSELEKPSSLPSLSGLDVRTSPNKPRLRSSTF